MLLNIKTNFNTRTKLYIVTLVEVGSSRTRRLRMLEDDSGLFLLQGGVLEYSG